MPELVRVDADVGHSIAALGADEERPAVALMDHQAFMRPENVAAIGLQLSAAINEEQAVESFEDFLSIAFHQRVDRFIEHPRVAGPLAVLAAVLAERDPREHLSFDVQLIAG